MMTNPQQAFIRSQHDANQVWAAYMQGIYYLAGMLFAAGQADAAVVALSEVAARASAGGRHCGQHEVAAAGVGGSGGPSDHARRLQDGRTRD